MHDINLIQIILVTLVAFVAGMASVLDERQFHRPLVACTLTGIAMGSPTTGIMVGGSLELLALGWMNVGAAMAPDSALASTVSTVIAVASLGDDPTKADIVRLLDLGVEAKEVNVGGMTFKQGTSQVSQAVYASPADVEAFKEIDSRGIKQYIQQVPSTASSDLMETLKDKGLL